MIEAIQGEVWFCDLDPTRGREQAGRRPALVVSVDALGKGASGLAIVAPITTTAQDNPIRPAIRKGEGGLREESWAFPDMVRSVSRTRLIERWGRVSDETLQAVAGRVRLLVRS